MPNYFYTAKTIDSQTKTGTAFADNERQLAQKLKDEELILVKAVSKEKQEKRSFWSSLFSKVRVSSAEKIIMTRNLHIMSATGLSTVKAFDILAIQTKNKKFKNALLDIKEKINKGQSLSEALALYPDIFSELFLSMVKVGEEAGTLDQVFQDLSLQLEKEHELKSKVQGAMIYPGIILLTMLGVGVVVVSVVIPHLNTFFSSINVELPIYTRIVLGTGNFASRNWPILLMVPFVLAFGFMGAIKTKQGKWVVDTIALKLPYFSLLIKENDCAILIRSLSSLMSSGVPMVRSLEVSSSLMGNHYFKRAVEDAGEKLKKGESLSASLRTNQDIFPFGMIEMMEVGEETGKTSEILKKLAEFYEQEVINATEKLSTAIEPILIVGLGIAVGIFAFSIIEPMYSVLGSIG
ncbi:MAG: type II secretion system F family protein [Candidatus Staskawiczbacteria bacterium]|nr:type II secretion system F family protein [Candidatus Staskawiczbacteria bacterium]